MTFLDRYQPQLLSTLRIVAGLLFLEHGTQKILGFPPMTMAIPPDHATIVMAAGCIELIGGALIVLGLFSRVGAFIFSREMAVVFCFVFLYLAASGPGPWAVNQR